MSKQEKLYKEIIKDMLESYDFAMDYLVRYSSVSKGDFDNFFCNVDSNRLKLKALKSKKNKWKNLTRRLELI